MMNRLKRFALGGAAIALFGAVPLARGNAVNVTAISSLPITGSALANYSSGTVNITDNFNNVVGTATFTEQVYNGSGGGLVFVAQVTNTSSGTNSSETLTHVSLSGFAGQAITLDSLATGSQLAPATGVNAGSVANGVADFSFVGTNIATGVTSSQLVIVDPGATSFAQNATITIDDGGSGKGASFAPAPLPATASAGLAMFAGLGILTGIQAIRRRRLA